MQGDILAPYQSVGFVQLFWVAFEETRSITPTVTVESLKMRNVSAVGCMIFLKKKNILENHGHNYACKHIQHPADLLQPVQWIYKGVKERIKYTLRFFFFF